MSINKIKEAALKYLKWGFSILPLVGKKPILRHGVNDASNDPLVVEEWWSRTPDANIGIATGEKSGILVIDVDVDHDKGKYGDESLNELIDELGPLPPSWECLTGSGGRHLYFQYPVGHDVRNSASTLGDNIDVRANGGYIVAPPSKHPDTGREYVWECTSDPEETPLAKLPDPWLERLLYPKSVGKKVKIDSKTGMTADRFKLPERIQEGQRNDVLFRYGASLRSKLLPAKEILDMMIEQNNNRCTPPLPGLEVEKIYDSIMKYPPGAPFEQMIENMEVRSGDTEADLKFFHHFNPNTGVPTGIYDYKIFQDILEHENLFILGGKPFIYHQGVYSMERAESWLKTKIRDHMFPQFIKSGNIERVYRLFFDDVSLQVLATDLNKQPSHWVNFQNGYYDPIEHKMIPHDPSYRSINQLPHSFDLEETWDGKVIEEWLVNFIPDTDDREMLLQYCGYCMTTDTSQQKFLVLYGEGGSGKSVLINLLEKAIGNKNISNVSLRELTQRFAPYNLMGKLLNACADLETTALDDTSTLKKILGEDTLRGEAKGKDAISFRNYAKLIFSTNELPLVNNERSSGFYRRLMILKIDTRPKTADPNFLDKLLVHIDSFIHLCIDALGRMYKAGTINETERSLQYKEDLRKESDSVAAWIEESCWEDSEARELRTDLFESYASFCTEAERSPLKRSNFYRALRDKGFNERKSNGSRYILGIRLQREIPELTPFS